MGKIYRITKKINEKRMIRLLKRSGMFDQEYYVKNAPDLNWEDLQGNLSPIEHYVRHGRFEGRVPADTREIYKKWLKVRTRKYKPNRKKEVEAAFVLKESGFFSEDWYIRQYPDVGRFLYKDIKFKRYLRKNGIFCAYHYISHGINEDRMPFPCFSGEECFCNYFIKLLFDFEQYPILIFLETHKSGFKLEEYLDKRQKGDISSIIVRKRFWDIVRLREDKRELNVYVKDKRIFEQYKCYFSDETVLLLIQDKNVLGTEIVAADKYFKNSDIMQIEIDLQHCILRSAEDKISFEDNYQFTDYVLKTVTGGNIVIVPGVESSINYVELNKFQMQEREEIKKRIYYNSRDLSKDSIPLDKVKWKIMISFYSFGWGGGEIMPLRLANELKNQGHSVLVHVEKTESFSEVRDMLRNDIPVVYTENKVLLCSLVDTSDINVINSHHVFTNSLMAYIMSMDVSFNNYVNHIATSHGMLDEALNVGNVKEIEDMFSGISEYVDAWTYVADKNVEPFKQTGYYYPGYIYKIPNGMQPPQIVPVERKELGIEEDAFVYCLVSRAIPEKGWKEAIEALEIAREMSNKDLQLVIVGSGEVYDQLKITEHQDYVHLVGHKKNPCDFYAMADVALLTSYFPGESAPLTLIEAMFSGVPIIATDIGDIKSMLRVKEDYCGMIFELENGHVPVYRVAELMVRMAQDSKMYRCMKLLAIEKSQSYKIDNIAKKYINIYRKKMQKNRILEK